MSPQIGHGRPRSKHPVADCLPLGRSLSLAVATDRPPRASKRRTTARPGGHIHEPVKVGGSSRGRFNALPAAAAVPPHDEIQMSPLVGEMEERKRSEIAHMAGPPPTATGQKGPWIVASPVEWGWREQPQCTAANRAAPPATIRIGRNFVRGRSVASSACGLGKLSALGTPQRISGAVRPAADGRPSCKLPLQWIVLAVTYSFCSAHPPEGDRRAFLQAAACGWGTARRESNARDDISKGRKKH